MRANRNTIFIVTLILALLASTAAAMTAWASAGSRQTININGGGAGASGLTTTISTNGTPVSGPGGGSGGGGTTGSVGGSSSSGGASGKGSGGSIGAGGTITVGGIFSESNGIDSTVEEDTVRACFDMYNAQGGINGHKLKLISYDDGLNGDTAYNEAVKLDTSDHVFAIVGWLAPFGEERAAPYFEQQGIPIVGGLGVPAEFNNRASFPVSPAFHTDGYLLGQYGAGHLHFKHIGVFLTKTAGIENVAAGIKAGAAANGVTISDSDIIYVSFGQGTFLNQLATFRNEGVDGLITQIDPYSYVRLYQDMQTNNYIFPHLAGAGIDKQSVDQAIGQPLQGVYSFMPYREAQGNPDGNSDVALYNSTLGHYVPGQVQYIDAFSEGSWVSCRVFAQALAKISGTVTRAALIQALNNGVYTTSGMAPSLNYGGTPSGDKNDAAHCALFITYTSSSRWKTATDFTCHY